MRRLSDVKSKLLLIATERQSYASDSMIELSLISSSLLNTCMLFSRDLSLDFAAQFPVVLKSY